MGGPDCQFGSCDISSLFGHPSLWRHSHLRQIYGFLEYVNNHWIYFTPGPAPGRQCILIEWTEFPTSQFFLLVINIFCWQLLSIGWHPFSANTNWLAAMMKRKLPSNLSNSMMGMDAVLPSFEAVIVLVNLSAPHFTNSRPDFQSAAGAGACLLPATQGPTRTYNRNITNGQIFFFFNFDKYI